MCKMIDLLLESFLVRLFSNTTDIFKCDLVKYGAFLDIRSFLLLKVKAEYVQMNLDFQKHSICERIRINFQMLLSHDLAWPFEVMSHMFLKLKSFINVNHLDLQLRQDWVLYKVNEVQMLCTVVTVKMLCITCLVYRRKDWLLSWD